MAIQLRVKKADGTIDEYGNVLGFKFDGEANWLTVVQGDENAKLRQRIYLTGEWLGCEFDATASSGMDGYEHYPKDAKVIG